MGRYGTGPHCKMKSVYISYILYMSFFTFLGIAAADTALEKNENQITFENFVVQAQKQSILTYKKGCLKGWFGKSLENPSAGTVSDTYLMLYDCLVDVNIITKQITSSSVFTWSNSYIISKTISLDAKNIEELLEKKNSSDYKKIKECFVIDFAKLSALLKKYTYNPTDQFNVIGKVVGGRRTRKQKKTLKTKISKKMSKTYSRDRRSSLLA